MKSETIDTPIIIWRIWMIDTMMHDQRNWIEPTQLMTKISNRDRRNWYQRYSKLVEFWTTTDIWRQWKALGINYSSTKDTNLIFQYENWLKISIVILEDVAREHIISQEEKSRS